LRTPPANPIDKRNIHAKGISGYLFLEPCKTFARTGELSLEEASAAPVCNLTKSYRAKHTHPLQRERSPHNSAILHLFRCDQM